MPGLTGCSNTARSQRGRFLKVSLKTNLESRNIPSLNQHQSGFGRLVILEIEFNHFASAWCTNTNFTVEMCCMIIPPGRRVVVLILERKISKLKQNNLKVPYNIQEE